MTTGKTNWLVAGSWVAYDFANTIYSFAIVTFLLPPTMRLVFHSDIPVSIVTVASMVFSGLVVPIMGVWTDRRPWTKLMLVWGTALCVSCCFAMAFILAATLGWPSSVPDPKLPLPDFAWLYLVGVCVLFFLANASYETVLMFYNSLMVIVAEPRHWGMISGLGVAVGYGGSLFALGALTVAGVTFVPSAIVLAGVSFLVFTLPLLFFVPERTVSPEMAKERTDLLGPLKEIVTAVKKLPSNRPLFLGLLGNFLCVDALNTLILFLTTYLLKTVFIGNSPLDQPVKMMMVGLILSAVGWSFINGWLSTKIGSIPSLFFAGVMLVVALIFGVTTTSHSTLFFWSVVLFGGAGLSGLWISGRKMVAELAPPEQQGLFFGLYGMTAKLGAVSTVAFAALSTWLPLSGLAEKTSYRFAMSFLLLPAIAGTICFALLVFRPEKKALKK